MANPNPTQPAVLVIGGGIAGIQASLDLADAGVQVHLVEREPTIGGHMAMFDKTFPTLDCSACILTPKMTTVGSHKNIHLMTYSEVASIRGSVGDYTVEVKRKAAYIDHDTCTGCGICIEKCPYKTESEFDQGLAKRKAVYMPFPQAVPNKPVIDRNVCVWFKPPKKEGGKKRCGVCAKFCEPKAVDFEQQERTEQYHVSAIVVTTGFQIMDMTRIAHLGYGRYPEVYNALEFERLNNAAGPTGGKVVTRDGRTPQSVAILHCTGSRDENYHPYCSRVCCMYALKYAHLIKEKIDGCAVYNFYNDMRCFGKGYEEFYKRLQHEGVRFVRGKAAQVWSGKEFKVLTPEASALEGLGDEQLVVQAEDTLLNELVRVPVDMVVLTPAFEARADSAQVAEQFGLTRDDNGFFVESSQKSSPVSTSVAGLFIAGGCSGAMDIPDTVAQGSATASKVLAVLAKVGAAAG
jgi:heterodisulfide reductase subunit A